MQQYSFLMFVVRAMTLIWLHIAHIIGQWRILGVKGSHWISRDPNGSSDLSKEVDFIVAYVHRGRVGNLGPWVTPPRPEFLRYVYPIP